MAVYTEDKRIEGHASSPLVGYAVFCLRVCTHMGELFVRNAHSVDFQD